MDARGMLPKPRTAERRKREASGRRVRIEVRNLEPVRQNEVAVEAPERIRVEYQCRDRREEDGVGANCAQSAFLSPRPD